MNVFMRIRLAFLFVTLAGDVRGHYYGSEEEYRLVRDILTPYNKKVKPSVPNNEPLNITFGVALAQIIDLDEKNQIITTNCWLNQIWVDPKLRWEPQKYGNISEIRIPFDSVWRPDIVLYNSAHISSESVSTNVIVNHKGDVMWLSMVILKSSCSINVKYFPFDTQHCTLDFSSWTFDAKGVNLLILPVTEDYDPAKSSKAKGDLSNYINSTEWALVSYIQERVVVDFSCCEVPYIFIKNHINIQRRPMFYVFNMVFPCLLITLVALLGFYMPSDSGEKISMGITTLLSMTVFLMIVADKMPPTSEDLPLVGLYYGITIAIVSFATGMTVFVLNIHHKGVRGREVPRILKTIFFGFIAKMMFIHLDLPETPPSPQAGMLSVNPRQSASGPIIGPKPQPASTTSNGEITQPVPQSDYYARFDVENKRSENGGISPRFSRKFTPVNTPNADNTERQFMRVLQKVYQTIEKNEMRLEDQDRRDIIKNEWQQLALVVDRLLLIHFLVLTSCINLVLILPGYYNQAEETQG